MYRILICDDELSVCNCIKQVICDYAREADVEITTEIFSTGESLLEYMKKNSDIDILFLDIELPGNNGAKTGKVIREELENEKVQIIFISSYEKYAMQLFQIRPFDFLIKPLNRNMIISVFEKYRKIHTRDHKFFEYKVGKHIEKILMSEIMYFECDRRRIGIVTKEKTIYFYGNMKEMHEAFNGSNFWSVHNSFIINVRYAKHFRENDIIMTDGSVIPISNLYKKEVKRKIMQYGEDWL